MNGKNRVKAMRIAMVVLLATLTFGATQAHAYCVYNRTQGYISEVHGEYCGSCLSSGALSPGGKTCCPGDKKGCRGDTLITVSVPGPKIEFTPKMHYGHCGKKVTAHGWVNIYGQKGLPGEIYSCEVYNDKGTLIWKGALIEGRE
ncbi:MAG: hypothetical protein PHH91_07315 [Desulfuromonadaceae bacterium]|nr:hypothetical protein [Desulfuromonadaceae bacterium]